LGATLLENPLGTAPGLLIDHHDKPVILMPGVPQEMEAILRDSVVPYLRQHSAQHVASFTLRTSGTYESKLQEKIGALPQQWSGAALAYLPSFFGVDLRVTVAGADAAAVARVAERAYHELRTVVAPVLYAEGSTPMEEVVGALLLERGWRIAIAESCTGGLVAKRLTDTPGSSRYVDRGFVTYSNASKVELLGVRNDDIVAHGAVSKPVAEQMAQGAAERAGVEVGVAVTGIAGPDGGSPDKPVGTVFTAVHDPSGTGVRRFHLLGTRASIRERATQAALDLVRRRLEGLPLDAKLD
jgi:nicotinamide-nucleotide amidase